MAWMMDLECLLSSLTRSEKAFGFPCIYHHENASACGNHTKKFIIIYHVCRSRLHALTAIQNYKSSMHSRRNDSASERKNFPPTFHISADSQPQPFTNLTLPHFNQVPVFHAWPSATMRYSSKVAATTRESYGGRLVLT